MCLMEINLLPTAAALVRMEGETRFRSLPLCWSLLLEMLLTRGRR